MDMDIHNKIAQIRLDMIDQLYHRRIRRTLIVYVIACSLITAAGTYVALIRWEIHRLCR
jgi:hypothetical protein